MPDGAGGHHHVVALYFQRDAAAGAHADKGIRADGVQLLHGDDGGGPADAGGADAHLLPQQGARPGGILPVGLHLGRIVEVGGDFFAAAGVSGQQAVPAHVPFAAFNMEL